MSCSSRGSPWRGWIRLFTSPATVVCVALGLGLYAFGLLTDSGEPVPLVLGVSLTAFGLLLPAIDEGQLGPTGLKVKTAARKGKEEEFDEFVAAQGGRFSRVGILLVADEHIAKNVVDDSLSRTYLVWDEVRAKPDLTVLCYLVRLSLRRAQVLEGSSPPDGATPTGRLAAKFIRMAPEVRAVHVLRQYEGLDDAEISYLLGKPVHSIPLDEVDPREAIASRSPDTVRKPVRPPRRKEGV